MSEQTLNWHGKPYYSLDSSLKNTFGQKVYKIALNGGFTCPNRDGRLGTKGCIFCSVGGSGEHAVKAEGKSVSEQIAEGLSLFHNKNTGNAFIAYFQAYTGTYAPVGRLRSLYTQALEHERIMGISIATRPDCLGADHLHLLAELKEAYKDKFIWIELGLQTIHENTAALIRRGYPLDTFEKAMRDLQTIGIPVIVHVILGLPGETPSQILETIDYLNRAGIFGIKLQLLHVLRGTDLARLYEEGAFKVYTLDEYLDILIECIAHLDDRIVLHRVTGDGPRDLLIAPLFSRDTRLVLNTLHRRMKETGIRQGIKQR